MADPRPPSELFGPPAPARRPAVKKPTDVAPTPQPSWTGAGSWLPPRPIQAHSEQSVFMVAIPWSEWPADHWPAQHFPPAEFAARSDGLVYIDPTFAARLAALRAAVGHPLRLRSGYHSPYDRQRAGMPRNHPATLGRAAEIEASNVDPAQLAAAAADLQLSVGEYPRRGVISVELRRDGVHRWTHPVGAVWPPKRGRFAPQDDQDAAHAGSARAASGRIAGAVAAAGAGAGAVHAEQTGVASASQIMGFASYGASTLILGAVVWLGWRYRHWLRAEIGRLWGRLFPGRSEAAGPADPPV